MTPQCIHAVISGTVQGVFFRKYTQRQAQQLELTGWVKNLDNGCVEVMACGKSENIKIFLDWLWQGSPDSSVENVEWQKAMLQNFDGFVVLR